MRAIVQRVENASVSVDEKVVGEIGPGLLVFVGVGRNDTVQDASKMATRIANLRVFPDGDQKINLSLLDIGGEALVISQFTLYADTAKGRRPSFGAAAPPDVAAPLVDAVTTGLRAAGITVAEGVFGASMSVSLTNSGPMTLWLET